MPPATTGQTVHTNHRLCAVVVAFLCRRTSFTRRFAGNEAKHWRAIQQAHGVSGETTTSATAGGSADDVLAVGTAVQADFGGQGKFYAGKVDRVNEHDDPSKITYDILYDDGDKERGVPRSRLKVNGGGAGGGGGSGGDSLLEVGTAVEANYAGKGNFYPGKINRINDADDPSSITYDILYDDGDRERGVPRSRLKVIGGGGGGAGGGGGGGGGDTLLEVGTKVEADYAGKGNYYPGKIKRINDGDDPSKITYDVAYDDGDSERGVPRSRLRQR